MTTGNQMAGIEGITYPYLSSLRFGPIRQVAGQNFYLDDLAVRNIANFSDDVNLAAAAIQIPEVTNENLSLPLSGAYGTTISWETSEEKIITKDGVITRPIGWNDSEVTLTATVSKGGINTTRNFDVTVEKLYPTEIQAIILKDKNGDLTYSMTSSGSLDKVLIKNNAALSGNVAAAIYDGDMLTDIKVMRNTDGLIEFGMNLPQEITNSTIKIFVWEDLSQMMPRAIPAVLTPVNAGKEKIKIYTIGDSTMATAAGKQAGWGEVLGAYFDPAKAEVDNSYSIGGASSKSSADTGRLNAMLGQLEPGDYVIIQFGHNDQKTEEPNNYTTPEDGGTYQQYLKRYINGVRAKGAYPVLATSICRRAFSNGVFTNTLGDYPRSMKALAEQLSVPLLDLNTKTEAALMEIGEQNSANYFMVANNDNTHLTEAGANWICTLAVEEMYRIGLPLTNCLAA